MALKSAQTAGVAVPAASYGAAREWMGMVSYEAYPGLYAYQPGRKPSRAMTAEGMFVQQLLGHRSSERLMQLSATFISQPLPDWQSRLNTYYWYYATLALFQHQGDVWVKWNEALTEQLLTNQRKEGRAAGSWDAEGEWSAIGGRVYQTALCALMLEVYYRYLPMYWPQVPEDTIGTIRGMVTDANTGEPLVGAEVRLVLPDLLSVSVVTAGDGSYELFAPEVPDHFALSASLGGYVPETESVESAMLQGSALSVDFQLQVENPDVVVMEPVPEVHHLGDNAFSGSINSQFQKRAEGDLFTAEFELTEVQLDLEVAYAEVHMLAKGVQRRHPISINGHRLDRPLDEAPSDGSFGEFVSPFPVSFLRVGTNTLQIQATARSSDIDDFEFVNCQIRLVR